MAEPTLSLQIDTPSAAGGLGYLILGDPVNGLLGTGLLAPDQIWVDQISKTRSISVRRGMSQFDGPLFRTGPGSLSAVLDNQTRLFDPASNPDIIAGRPVRLRATHSAITYDMFRGVVNDWNPDYPGQSSHGDAITTIACDDGFSQLGNLSISEQRGSETTGARIAAIANLVDWPRTLRSIDPGLTTMPASVQTVSATAALFEAADSDMGELYVAADGTMTFRDRNSIVADTRSRVSQATFGDGGGTEKKFVSFAADDPLDQVRNIVTITYNDDGDSVTASDAESIARWGPRDDQLTLRITNPNTAASIAKFLVGQFSQPIYRLRSITIRPRRDPTNLYPQVLGRKLGDRITGVFQPPGGGARISHDCFIRGIQHDIKPGLDWTTTFITQDASLWPSVFILGSSLLGSSDILWF